MSRKAIAIVVAALVAITAIWYLVLWSPQGASLKKAQASANSAQSKEADLRTQVVTLQRQRAQLPALREHLAELKQAIPTTADIDKVIDQVNGVVQSTGVVLTSLSPPAAAAVVPGAGTAGAAPLSMSVTVTGTYFQLITFINKLNTMPRLAVVDGFSLGTPDKTGKMSTTILARVFAVPVVAAAPAATTTTTTTGGK